MVAFSARSGIWLEGIVVAWLVELYFAFGITNIGDMAQVGPNCAEAVDENELYAFVGNALVLNGEGGEQGIYLSFLLRQTNDIHFFVSPLYVSGDIVKIDTIIVRFIFKIFEFSPLDERLSGALAVGLVVDDEVYPACGLDCIDVFDDRVDFIEFYV